MEDNNTFEEEIPEYNEEEIVDEEYENNDDNPDGQEEEEQYVPLSQWAEQELGWQGVPDNPYEALLKMKQGYDEVIADLQSQLGGEGYEDDEEQELHNAFKEFSALSKENVIVQDLLDNGYTEEEAQEELNDLISDGKLDKEYRKIKASVKKEYEEALGYVKETFTQRQEQLQKEQELNIQRQQLELKKSINSLESEHFEITKKDKQFLEDVYFKPTKSGQTILQEILNDPQTLSEMILTYLKVDNIKGNVNNIKKQVATNMANRMSKEPLLNAKQTKGKTKSIFD